MARLIAVAERVAELPPGAVLAPLPDGRLVAFASWDVVQALAREAGAAKT